MRKYIDRVLKEGIPYYFQEYLNDFDESFGDDFGALSNAEWNELLDKRIKYLEDNPPFIPISEEDYYELLHFDKVKDNVLYLVIDDPLITEIVEKINGKKSGIPSTYYKYLPLVELINGCDYGIELWNIKLLIAQINDGYDSKPTSFTSLEDILLEITGGMTLEEYNILKLMFRINDTIFGKPSDYTSVDDILIDLLDGVNNIITYKIFKINDNFEGMLTDKTVEELLTLIND